MDAKLYLKQAYRLNELIQSNKQELDELNELKGSISAIDYSKDRVQTSASSDATFTKIVDKIVELENAINADIDRMLSLKLEIRTVINDVRDNDEKLLLKYRYLNFMSWEDICSFMNISIRTAFRIHTNALNNVQVPGQVLECGTC